MCVYPSVNPDSVSDHQNDSGGENDDITSSSLIAKAELIKEQRDDETLRGCWKLAERGQGSFLIDDGILHCVSKKSSPFCFSQQLSQMLTDFNNICQECS